MKQTVTITLLLTLFPFLAFGQTNYLMNATLTNVNNCAGFFMDSGGGANGYGPNQNFTTTICPGGGGTHIQLIFSGPQIAGGDELCFFDGNTTGATSLGCASDFTPGAPFIIQATAANPGGCLTLTFNSDATGQAQGWSADINCIPSCQTILSLLGSTDPAVEPVDTGYIDICPGERVFFNGMGSYPQNGIVYNHSDLTSDFEWDFGDGTITYGPSVSKVFDEPGGYIVQLGITDQLGCKNTNFISQRVRVAPRPNFGAGQWPTEVCVGDTILLNAMIDSLNSAYSISVEPNVEGFQTAGIRSDSLPLPDGNGACYETTISFTSFSPGQLLTNINDLLGIWVNMEHTWMRDLQITLTCPNGQDAILHNHPGQTGGEVFLGIPYENDEGLAVPIPGLGWDYGWQTSPDYNQTWIQYANSTGVNTLPSGSYNSFEPLTSFLGCPLNGDWSIEVCDLWGIDNGYIFSWSIEFAQDLYPAIETFSPGIISWNWNNHPSIFFQDPDSLAGSPFNAGEVGYTFVVEDEFGCAWDTLVEIQVLPVTHPDCRSCGDLLQPVADTTICTGEQVELDAFAPTATETDVTFESYVDYEIGAGNHPPASPYFSVININSINPGVITNPVLDIVSVCLDLQTDFDADIQLFLRSPDGTLLELSTNNGGGGDNYTQTCFTPTASTPIQLGTVPFTGNFIPEGSWNVLNGDPINGNWALRVSDAFGLNAIGKLNWWSITFRSENDVNYLWGASPSLSCNNCPTTLATPASNETFIVTAVDAYGCEAFDTVSVAVLNNFSAPTVACASQNGGQITFNWNDVNPGLGYEVNVNGTGWVPANNGNTSHLLTGLVNGDDVSIEVRTIVNGAACVVGVGSSFCQYLLCPLSSVLSPQGPYAVSCASLCDESVQISVSNGVLPFNFDVSNLTTGDNFSQQNGNLVNLCPGSYQVVITDATNCVDTVDFIVNDQSQIIVTALENQQVSCNGGTDGCAEVSATGGVGPYIFEWSDLNNSTGALLCNLPAGPYNVTASDLNGCTSIDNVLVTEPGIVTLTPSTTAVNCFGGNDGTASVSANGGTPGYTYQWSGGDTPNAPTTGGLIAGIYSVTVEDLNGCEAFTNVTVNGPANGLTVNAVQTVQSCNGQNQSEAMATPVGGTGPFSYEWFPTNQTNQTIDMLAQGPYTVTVTDGSGCTATATVLVTQLEPIEVTLAGVPPVCHDGLDGEMAANIVTGGAGGYTYFWNTADTDAFINGVQGGLVYSVTVTDMQGCTGEESRLLENPAEIVLNLDLDDALCNGNANGVANIVSVANNQGPVTYQWDAAALNQTTAIADSLSAGVYTVVATDMAGCSIQELVEINEPDALALGFQTVDNECFGEAEGTIDLTVLGGNPTFQYNWSNNGASANLTDLEAAVYQVTVTDANGCEISDSIEIEQPEPVDFELVVQDVRCFGEKNGSISIEAFGGTPPFLYSIDDENYFGSSTLIALAAGDYGVFVKDAKGCVFNQMGTVNEPSPITAAILANGQEAEDLVLNEGAVVDLEALVENGMGDLSYQWSASYCGTLACGADSDCDFDLPCQFVVSRPDYAIDYYLFVEDENGCKAEDLLRVQVQKTRVVEVPTGFTPNGDQANNRLVVHGKANTMVNIFQVFDRWGELLYEDFLVPINENAVTGRGWDGTFKGSDMPSGVYIWYVEVTYADGMTESFKGETTLIR